MKSGIARYMLQAWMQRGTVAKLLWPLSQLFRMVVATRRYAYLHGYVKSVRLPVPVIVVGNLFVGGTGKTPLTIWLVQQLQHAGYRPGVISRGYGRKNTETQLAYPDSNTNDVGDEPALIAQRTLCPVMVGRDRAAAGQALLVAHPEVDVIVADDGLQHYRLDRDIEIILSDSRGGGNGWLLPAGPLREPSTRPSDFNVENIGTASSIRRRNRPAVVGKTKLAVPMRMEVQDAVYLPDPSYRVSLSEIAALVPVPVILATAGIGNPARFFESLRHAGVIFETMPLPDHHVFNADTFAGCRADVILITEKDAVKCREVETLAADTRLWIVPVNACIDQSFADDILEKLRGLATARHSGMPDMQRSA